MDDRTATTLRIVCIALNVTDLSAARAFYERALGFAASPGSETRLRLGAQEIELHASSAPGRPYPEPRAANDPWFQHFAIAVSDMGAAYARLAGFAAQPISHGGPQRLPASTGGVTAYKFRDPDGHPLELSLIPHSAWTRPGAARAGPFQGVDHCGLAVRDLAASVAFYTQVLGFTPGERLLNQGPEQDRLDGLDGVRLDIAVLKTAEPGPHIELLHYRQPICAAAPINLRPPDIAATQLVLQVADLATTHAALAARGLWLKAEAAAILTRDPDGRWLRLIG
jgi:catechol 2,3-dioxygenase-like lactoylglutathione lyase family enzyme